jgi:transposase
VTDNKRTQRRFTLTEKLAIVRESLAPGITASHVARRHGVALNLLYYWRKAYRELLDTDLTKAAAVHGEPDRELEDLRLQVRNLERLLGQRRLEIALLKEQLGKGEEDDATQ